MRLISYTHSKISVQFLHLNQKLKYFYNSNKTVNTFLINGFLSNFKLEEKMKYITY